MARRAQDSRQACRLLSIAMVLEGASRTDAARAGGMEACCKAWNDLLATPARLASITAREWAKAS